MTVNPSPQPQAGPRLLVSHKNAAERIQEQIDHGRQLELMPVDSESSLEQLSIGESQWYDFSYHLLTVLFDDRSIANEFGSVQGSYTVTFILQNRINQTKTHLGRRVAKLESILKRLDMIPEVSPESPRARHKVESLHVKTKVFVVHGRDTGAREMVARFLERLDLEPIILREQPNRGRTIIEKFEDYSNVAFAVVLLTGDDQGGLRGGPFESQNPRARQNVILELGFFLGKLGREHACALYEPGVEIPSDYQGVLFVELDNRERWHLDLAKEMKAAGLPVDLNQL